MHLSILHVLAIASIVGGCSSIVPISQRGIGGAPGELHVSARPVDTDERPADAYVKRSKLRIERKPGPSQTGSLFQSDNAANYLASEPPLAPGSAVLVKVASKAGAKGEGETAGDSRGAAGGPAAGDVGADLEAIIKSLPNLDAGSANPPLVKQFRMIVTRILDNGDYEGVYKRVSQSGSESNAFEINARIPREVAVNRGDVSTTDLSDVTFFESRDGALTTRESSEWEDEYTLRLSGFTEARSQAALDLEGKRQQLDEAKKKVETKLQTMGAERRQVAKERETLAKEKNELDQKMRQLNEELETLRSKVREQEGQPKSGDGTSVSLAPGEQGGGEGG